MLLVVETPYNAHQMFSTDSVSRVESACMRWLGVIQRKRFNYNVCFGNRNKLHIQLFLWYWRQLLQSFNVYQNPIRIYAEVTVDMFRCSYWTFCTFTLPALIYLKYARSDYFVLSQDLFLCTDQKTIVQQTLPLYSYFLSNSSRYNFFYDGSDQQRFQ